MQFDTESSFGQERAGIGSGALMLISAGCIMLALWVVTLLPGRDIAAWKGRPVVTEVAMSHPTVAPAGTSQVLVMKGSHLFHWNATCPLFKFPSHRNRTWKPIIMTCAKASSQGMQPCTYCDDISLHK